MNFIKKNYKSILKYLGIYILYYTITYKKFNTIN